MKNLGALVVIAALVLCAVVSRAVVPVTSTSVGYQCNGAATRFPVPFPGASIAVTLGADGGTTALSPDGGYAFSSDGGEVVLPSACDEGETLTITRCTPLTQPNALASLSTYFPSVYEGAYDLLTEQTQDIDTKALAQPVCTSVATSSTTISILAISAKATSGSTITVTWATDSAAATYELYRSTSETSGFARIATTTAGTYGDTGLTEGVTYHYYAKGFSSGGELVAATGIASAQTTVGAPATLTATATSTSTVDVSWSSVVGATTYDLYRSASSSSGYAGVYSDAGTAFGDTGLSAGTTYYYYATATSDAGFTGPSSPIASALTFPAAPTDAGAAATSASTATVTWASVTSATSYAVYRSMSADAGFASAGTSTSLAFGDTGLDAGTTYYYYVTASNASGTSSASSTVSTITYPSAPTLSLSATSTSVIVASWTAPTSATAFAVYRSTSSSGPWTNLGAISSSPYTDSGLTAGTTYYYYVTASNASGASAASNIASTATYPAAPASIAATAISASTATVTCSASTGATGYQWWRSTSGGSYSSLGTTTSTTFSDTGLSAGTTYTYYVKAYNGSGYSGASSTASALTYPAAPTSVSAAASSSSTISVSWGNPTSATSYAIYRSTSSSSGFTVLATGYSSDGYTDSTCSAGTTYYYYVTASNASGTSVASSTVSAMTYPAAPATVTATATSASTVTVSWSASTGTAGYTVYKSTSSDGTYTDVYTGGASLGTSVSVTGLSAGTTYYFYVKAYNTSGTSDGSSIVSALTYPAAPTGVSAIATSSSSIYVSWASVSTATSYYVFESSTSSTSGFSSFLIETTTHDTWGSLKAGTTYYFYVTAVNASGSSASSSVVSALTYPTGPDVSLSSSICQGSVTVSWTAPTSAVSYYLYRSTSSGGTYSAITAGTGLTYTDTSVTNDTTYYYKASACNASGCTLGGYSAITPECAE